MSNALLRRNSSKQGLQNLMRLTAQRSVEDAEELERERRRRAREAVRRSSGGSPPPGGAPPDGDTPAGENTYDDDDDLKPRSSPSLEEDEGFSDWTQRRERRRRQRLQELGQGGEEDEDEEDAVALNGAVPTRSIRASSIKTSSRLHQRQEEEEEAMEARREKEEEEEEQRRREEIQRHNSDMEKRKDVKVSYTSKVFLHSNSSRDAADEEVTAYTTGKAKQSRAVEPGEAEAALETEQRLEKIRRGLQEKESQDLEQLRHRQAEAEQELEGLKRRREERRRARVEEERRRQEEEQQRLSKEEDERRQMKEDIERRRMDAAERMKGLSTSNVDGDEMFSPFSPKAPNDKITETTKSLNRSLKKSNSFKKTQPPVLVPKIDDKLEQYAHAVENSQEPRAAKASLTDLINPPEVVASKKSLFEAGEAWSQSPGRGSSCRDTDGLKVGVASLITQWVKGPADGGRQPAGKPADVKPGDVMQKKNMWEVIGDSSASGPRVKGSTGSKKYKFVVTGHGKYEKIPLDGENETEFTNGKLDLCPADY